MQVILNTRGAVMSKFIIKDWASNILFNEKQFKSFDDAEEFLCEFFSDNGSNYEEERGEYYIEEVQS